MKFHARIALGAIIATGLCFFEPSPALADLQDDDRHDVHEQAKRIDRHYRADRRHDLRKHRDRPSPRAFGFALSPGIRVRYDAPYYCAHCNSGFRSAKRFTHHLHHRHRVAAHRIPRIVVQGTGGWVFAW